MNKHVAWLRDFFKKSWALNVMDDAFAFGDGSRLLHSAWVKSGLKRPSGNTGWRAQQEEMIAWIIQKL